MIRRLVDCLQPEPDSTLSAGAGARGAGPGSAARKKKRPRSGKARPLATGFGAARAARGARHGPPPDEPPGTARNPNIGRYFCRGQRVRLMRRPGPERHPASPPAAIASRRDGRGCAGRRHCEAVGNPCARRRPSRLRSRPALPVSNCRRRARITEPMPRLIPNAGRLCYCGLGKSLAGGSEDGPKTAEGRLLSHHRYGADSGRRQLNSTCGSNNALAAHHSGADRRRRRTTRISLSHPGYGPSAPSLAIEDHFP
jgi:hypothetical protein